MGSAAAVQTISLDVNKPNLFKALRFAFSEGSVLGELIQNARRAKATRVVVQFDGTNLTVNDDGIGVIDLQNMVSAASSGWDQQTIQDESPFGLGFLATLYSCRAISVETHCKGLGYGQAFTASTEDVLSMRPLPVHKVQNDFKAGTTVVLKGLDLSSLRRFTEAEERVARLKGQMEALVKGFPIDVLFNGEVLKRSDALNEEYQKTEIGYVRLNIKSARRFTPYVQGLPVESNPHWKGSTVHLYGDIGLKLPDRQHFLDSVNVHKKVNSVLDQLARVFLESEMLRLTSEEFLKEYESTVRDWSFEDMLNRLDIIPGEWLVNWEEQGVGVPKEWEDTDTLGGSFVDKASLLAAPLYEMPDDDDGLAKQWLKAGKYPTLCESLPKGHWLADHVQLVTGHDNRGYELLDNGAVLRLEKGEAIGEAGVSGWYFNKLYVVENLTVINDRTGEAHSIHGAYCTGNEDAFVFTREACAWEFVTLGGRYTDENDSWDESGQEADEAKLQAALQQIVATCAVDVLNVLIKHGALNGTYEKLAGRTFALNFDEKGRLDGVRELDGSIIQS